MKFRILMLFVGIVISLQSCLVTESIVFNEDGSGDFMVKYDLSEMQGQIGDMFKVDSDGGDDNMDYNDAEDMEEEELSEEKSKEFNEEEGKKKTMDTLIYFDDYLKEMNDSIQKLSDEDRRDLENLKGMYMKMKTDEENGIFEMGIGMEFKSIDELKDIQDRVNNAKDYNTKQQGVDEMTENSPMSALMKTAESEVIYKYENNVFSRLAEIQDVEEEMEEEEEENEEELAETAQFNKMFEDAYYTIEYTFPKKIKSTSVEGAEISEDGKTISYAVPWMKLMKDPKILDIKVELENE